MNFLKYLSLLCFLISTDVFSAGIEKDSVRIINSLPSQINEQLDPIVHADLPVDTVDQKEREKAAELDKEVHDGNLIISDLHQLAYLKLPVGIQKQIGPLEYTIIISNMESTPSGGSVLEAYFMFEIPNTGDKIAFRGTKIPFSNSGGFSGRGRLELIGDYHIVLNSSTLLSLIGKGNSFVEFDCEGFAGMALEASVEFSRDLIVPEDQNGEIIPAPARVETNFRTQIQNWNDILIGVNIPTFQVNGLKNVSFTIQDAFLDWSDLMNPAGMQFPSGYVSPFLESGGQPSLWQGVYVKRVDVSLPKAFGKKENAARVTIGVENMLLDDQGFTGKVFAENVLSSGDMSGWEFTIDSVSLDLVINEVRSFEVDGKLTIPELETDNGDKAKLNYIAHKGADGSFLFAITMAENLKLPVFGADLKVFQGSGVTVAEKNDQFFPTVLLNGELSIAKAKAKFDRISFQGLRISTEEPHFDFQYVGFGNSGQQKVSKFPVVINGLALRKASGKIGLEVDLTVNIGGSPEEAGFGGGGKVTVWGKQDTVELKNAEGAVVGTDTKWKFDKIEIGGININVRKPNVYEFKGTISFFEDNNVYGDGFFGAVSGSINKIGPISIQTLFGNTGEFRYWYADALVKLPTSLPIIPGVLMANSFGGGFYYKMKQTDQQPSGSVALKDQSGAAYQQATAVYYVPDKNSLGIKAIVGIEAQNKAAMNGIVMLELMMNRHGGINSVTLSGNANFMSFAELATSQIKDLAGGAAAGKLSEKLGALAAGQVRGSVRLMFDNVNDVFHGNLEVFINVAGGLVKGIGTNDRAGWAVLHFEKDDWYIHIGTPTDPLGIEVAKIFKSKSYFMMGKNLPGSPPPPSQVTEILGPIDLDYMRDMNALASGAGFAFGLHFIVDTGDLQFLMFYGRFAAGTGVDFMLKDYGTGYHCQGSSGPFGINGWYANGQAYAFVMGKVGIKVKLKFYKGNYDILNIGAAAVLQAKGPNPFWMKGTVGGYYSILGGMVKGNCKFDVEIGEKCVPIGEQNVLADQQMIAEVSPAEGSEKVDVFTAPQVAFNIPVGEVFNITDIDNRTHSFRATLNQFEVFDEGQALVGSLNWNEDKNVVVFNGSETLPGEKNLIIKVRLVFEERKNGVWTRAVFDGFPVEEFREVSFKTDKAPDYIPSQNVIISYPVTEQVNFLPEEYDQGLVQLRLGQSYLFSPGPQWNQNVRMTKEDGTSFVEIPLTYNADEKKISFVIPRGLEKMVRYNFEIVNTPSTLSEVDDNVKNIESQLETQQEGAAILTTKNIEGVVERRETKTLYRSVFRTSRYKTFTEKVAAITHSEAFEAYQQVHVSYLFSRLIGDENFDAIEITGTSNYRGLMKIEADLSNTPWFNQDVNPYMYHEYPYLSLLSVTRQSPDLVGIPPARDITIEGGQSTPGSIAGFRGEYMSYNIMRSVASDYYEMQLKAANYLVDRVSSDFRLQHFLTEPPPFIHSGSYFVNLTYQPPGAATVTSSLRWNLFNPTTSHGR